MLELLAMVLGTCVIVVLRRETFVAASYGALLWGDNHAAVHRVNRCPGGAEPRWGDLMRLLGVFEVAPRLLFYLTRTTCQGCRMSRLMVFRAPTVRPFLPY